MARTPEYAKALDENGIEILVGDVVEHGCNYEHTTVVESIDPIMGCPHIPVTLSDGCTSYAYTLRVVLEE